MGNLKNEISNLESVINEYVINDIVVEGYDIRLEKDGNLYVEYMENNLNEMYGKYKISDNVLSCYVINTGQDVGNTLYFIKDDGTVGSANTEYGLVDDYKEITVTNDLGYKNIVTILPAVFSNEYTGARGPIFVDISGNIFSDDL